MNKSRPSTGCLCNGLPYNRMGDGPRPLVAFQGLVLEHKPLSGFLASLMFGDYNRWRKDYTVYLTCRKPGLPDGYSMRNFADDYAAMIEEEFGGPVDVLGVSTGGSIVQHFAADHPGLVRKLVIHSSAHTLSDSAKALQWKVGELARRRQWREVYATLFGALVPHQGAGQYVARPLLWLGSLLAGKFAAPGDPRDLAVTVEAEDKHNFKERLAEITAPTLVVAGDKDPFYTETLFRETAAGIPNAKLILYKGMGHPASGKQFAHDVLTFLKESASGQA